MAGQVLETVLTSIKTMYPQVPAAIWAEFEAEANPDEFVELVIPIYAKHWTLEEMQQLQVFYQSPLGQKVLKTLPAIMQDSMAVGQEWGRQVAERVLKRLMERGYAGKAAAD